MSEFGVGFRMYCDSSGFIRGMREAGEASKAVEKGLKDTFGRSGLFQSLSIAGFVSAFVGGILKAADAAQELRDTMEATGKKIDMSTASAARFGDALDAIKKTFSSASVNVLGFVTEIGENIGSTINGLRGISVEQEKVAVQAERDADKQVAARDKLYKAEFGNRERLAALDKQIAAARAEAAMKEADDIGKVFLLRQRQIEIQKQLETTDQNSAKYKERQIELAKVSGELAEADKKSREVSAKFAKDAADAEEKAANDRIRRNHELIEQHEKLNKLKFEALPLVEQENILTGQIAALEKGIRELKLFGNRDMLLETDLLEKQKVLAGIRERIEKETAQAIKNQTAELQEQNRIMVGIRGGQQFNDLSDAALQELVRRNRATGADLTNVSLVGPVSARFNADEAARLAFEADNAQKILDSRNQLRRNVSMFGVERARTMYQGDPTQFDALVQRWVQDTRSQQDIARESNKLLEDLNNRLLVAGFTKS